MTPSASNPVELLSEKPHPFNSLSKMFSSFCDPQEQEHDEQQSREINSKPAAVAPEPKNNNVSAAKPYSVPAADTSREFKVETPSPYDPPPNDPPMETESVEVSLEESKPERILKTAQEDKQKNVVVVESGISMRTRRILEKVIFVVVVLVVTIFELQWLGHQTGFNFGSLKPSAPIKFDLRMDEAVKPTDVDPVPLGGREIEAAEVEEEETVQQDAVEPVAAEEKEAFQQDTDAPDGSTEVTPDEAPEDNLGDKVSTGESIDEGDDSKADEL